MPRRSELQGIANNLVKSFVSRNNDVNGYWALGKMYVHAKRYSPSSVSLQLPVAKDACLQEPLSTIATNVENLLEQLLQKQALPAGWLDSARILVEFESPDAKPRFFHSHATGRPFLCKVSLTDDLARTYEAHASSWCWPHDPAIENQSLRA